MTAGFSLVGRRALVTGGTRGIGLAIAQGFIAAGADVWIHGRDPEDVAIANRIGAQFLHADLSDPAAISRLGQQMATMGERLDILVNNAGVETPMAMTDLSLNVLDETWAVNARAPVLVIQAMLPLLQASGNASVINITSIHADIPYAGNIAYCMAKAAQEMSTRVAAIELAPYGVRVNSLAPGAIETDINRSVLDEIGRDKFAEWIPSGRVGTVAEVVGPAIFLASEAASYVTGASVCADGAYSRNLVRYRADSVD